MTQQMPQHYCLRWKHHHTNVQNMFAQLLEKERFCDVTLYCSPSFASQVTNKDTVEPQSIKGVSLRAHRVVLAACSELLGTLLGAHEAHGEPVLVIDGAEPKHLRALLDYMYTGEMNVHHSQLASLLKTAEELRIKGLTDIRWNNKDEPPDSASGAVATTTVPKTRTADVTETERKQDKKSLDAKKQQDLIRKYEVKKQLEAKLKKSPERPPAVIDLPISEPRTTKDEKTEEKVNVNGGPPPLIKLDLIKNVGTPKREHNSDSESLSPKRRRIASGTEITNDGNETNSVKKPERDREPESEQWRHRNMDISASRVPDEVAWGGGSIHSGSDDDWADTPADIGSFLDTRLQIIGDNSIDEESNDSSSQVRSSRPASAGSSGPNTTPPIKQEPSQAATKRDYNALTAAKSFPSDPRFSDVIKLNQYLQHGRRPQFWEEHYVKRVMESVRVKELEMKQAAEILGVSYGTLYGRYRDVYGCINRPYRAVRDFWQVKGPSEVLERLQRGEISLETAASALGVSAANLAAHVADFPSSHPEPITEFEPIPIEVDPALRQRTLSAGSGGKPATKKSEKDPTDLSGMQYVRSLVKIAPKVMKCQNPNASDDDEAIPSTIISTDNKVILSLPINNANSKAPGSKWPAIRVASIDSLRDGQPPAPPATTTPAASASQLMKTRPDLTIVAKKQKEEDT